MTGRPIPDSHKLLGSWKEIACYLGKGVRTVQRWEQYFGLPVRRPQSASRGVICATPEELDAWLNARWTRRPAKATPPALNNPLRLTMRSGIQAHHELLHTTHRLMGELTECIQAVAQECVSLTLQNNGSHPAPADDQKVANNEEREIQAGKDCRQVGQQSSEAL
jgi:hypothetical protein